jgi:hypothetical protein
MPSESDPWFQTTPKQRYDAAIAKYNVKAAARKALCVTYTNRLRNRGFDVTPEWVENRFSWVDTWANGLIAIGHLVNRTGMRRMTRLQYAEWIEHMSVPKVVMLDTIGTCAANIPAETPFIGAYASGTGVVPWTSHALSLFPKARIFRIYQNGGAPLTVHEWDVLDVETRAFTVAEATQEVKDRVDAGIVWTTIYGSRPTLKAMTASLKALGEHYWNGHVNYWLADWNLNQEEASALIDTFVEGASCVAVQWASPSSNPNSPVPGGSHTLAQTNLDISVANGNWHPSGGFSAPAEPKPAPVTHHGELITDDGKGRFTSKAVSSTDDTHWQ